MADGFSRYHTPGAGPFYQSHHTRSHNHNRTLSPHGPRRPFTNDTPSPSRSPASAAMAHNFNMFNQNGFQNQHMMNGGQNHNRFGGMHMQQKHQNYHGHHNQHHANQQHSSQLGHQHNISGGAFPGNASHLGFGQGGALQNGSDENMDHEEPDENNEYWQEQHKLIHACSEASEGHHRARTVAQQTKGISFGGGHDPGSQDVEDRVRNAVNKVINKSAWTELDLGGQGLCALSSSLFKYHFLTRLDLCHNNLRMLPPELGQLKRLEHLDISYNQLTALPDEIGMLTNLNVLFLFANPLQGLPDSLGYLYKLNTIGIYGVPGITREQKTAFDNGGTKGLINFMLENMPDFEPPNDREWHQVEELEDSGDDTFKAVTYNILAECYTPRDRYGYVPERYLDWDYRRQLVLDELTELNADVVCLQELDKKSYDEFFAAKMKMIGYKAYFAQKARADTIGDRANMVDGCGTFWKEEKYIELDKRTIIIGRKFIEGKKTTPDMINRVWQRDDIATVTFLENRVSGSRLIVVNAHIFWDPLFKDVKLIQAATIMDEVNKMADSYAKWPAKTNKQYTPHPRDGENAKSYPEPGPSVSYTAGNQIPMLVCGDFNSAPGSPVYELFTKRILQAEHADFTDRNYGDMSANGMTHSLNLKSINALVDSHFITNYTPDFVDELDHVFYSSNSLRPIGVLGQIDPEYLKKVPGFPNQHFPSDHLALMAQFLVEKPRVVQKTEADFGPSSRKH